MKTAKLLIGATLFLGSLTSCDDDNDWFCIEGNGNTETESRTINSFTKLELNFDAEVYISQGPTSLSITASDNLFQYIETDVQGSKLSLDIKGGRCIDEDDNEVKIYVSSPSYTAIELYGSGDISNDTPLDLLDLEIDINGSGDVSLDDLSVDDYEISISGSGEVSLSGDSADVGIIEITGSGDVKVDDLVTNDLTIDISGSGDADVNVVDQLKVDISGSGDVKYSGNPSVDVDVTGSGNVIND